MANNRLYMVNKNTKQFVCIAKSFGNGWRLGNVNNLKNFLLEANDFSDKSELIIITENDKEYHDVYLDEKDNYNRPGHWVYVEDERIEK
jgi:archaellum biogenesis ATPase FlaH